MAELEVQNKQEHIKNSVNTEKQSDVENFLKDLETAKKEKWSDETTIATWANIINKVVWKEVFNKGKDYQTYKEKVVEVFNSKGEIVLNNIKDNVTTKINDVDRNDQADKTVININAALQAFTTDIAEYSGKGETLSAEIAIIEEIKKLITDKQTAVKKEESNKMNINALLNAPITKESAINFFDNSNPEVYNGVIEQVVGTLSTPIDLSPTSTWDAKKLYDRCVAYMGDMSKISGIKLGKPDDFTDARNRYVWIAQRVIEYKQDSKTRYIIHGSHDNLQKELAKKNANILNDTTDIDNRPRAKEEVKTETKQTIDWKTETIETRTRVTRLNAFDDKGNYALFNKYLEKKWPEYVKANLAGIMQAINVYAPWEKTIDEEDNKLNVFKNGYATTITDYVIAHREELLESYTNQITENNLNIFGVDQQTRSANFNKLVKRRNETGLRQRLPKAKQDELIRIKTKIENFDLPKTKEEAIKKWLDSIIDTFGPMLFNILKFFGIGKATLCKRFSTMTEKINSMFQKEYGLSPEQISAINEISESFVKTEIEEELPLDTAQKIQKKFEKQKDTYIGLFSKKENYENLSVERIKAWLKAKGGSTTIDNIITIKKDKKTGKEYIDAITDEETFKGILWYLFDTEETRTEIHNANKEIQRPNKDNKTITEHNKSREDAARYIIKTDRDIARYLTASWFSTKDLDYVMTENSLHNGSEIQNDTPEPNKNEVLVFDEKYVDKTGKVIDQSKRIHEVIKMDNLPTNIKITKANGTVIEATLVTLADGIKTYVEKSKAKNQKLTIDDRVQIVLNDVISLPESKNIEQVRTETQAILEKSESKNAQIEYENPNYTSNKKNIYQQNIQTFWNLFEPTEYPYYDQLIAEKDNKTLKKIIENNMVHIKNMFLNWWKIDENLTKRDKNVIDIDKQNFVLKEAKDGKIIITVTKKNTADTNTKNGTIIFDKNEKGNYIQRKEEVAAAATPIDPTATPTDPTATTDVSTTTTAVSKVKWTY